MDDWPESGYISVNTPQKTQIKQREKKAKQRRHAQYQQLKSTIKN